MWNIIVTAFVEYIMPFIGELPPVLQTLLILGALWLGKQGFLRIPVFNRNIKRTHQECALYNDHQEIVKQERSKAERIHQIKYYDTIFDQMSEAETVSASIEAILTDAFSELVENSSASELRKSEARQTYSLIINWALDDAKGYLRKWIKRNGYTSFDPESFQTYKHKRAEELQKLLKKNIDRKYLKSQLLIDRKEVYSTNMQIFYEQIQTMLDDMFTKIRHIAEKSEVKIEAIEKE